MSRGDNRSFRRVKWKVRRTPSGWLPLVLIGEEPVAFPIMGDKHEARAFARSRAKQFRAAGQM
jgi:hypothetical protein